jgi:hypothetical protein
MKVLTDKVILGKDLEIGRAYVLVSCSDQVSSDENSMHFVMKDSLVDNVPRTDSFYEVKADDEVDFPAGGVQFTTSDEYFIRASADNLIEKKRRGAIDISGEMEVELQHELQILSDSEAIREKLEPMHSNESPQFSMDTVIRQLAKDLPVYVSQLRESIQLVERKVWDSNIEAREEFKLIKNERVEARLERSNFKNMMNSILLRQNDMNSSIETIKSLMVFTAVVSFLGFMLVFFFGLYSIK